MNEHEVLGAPAWGLVGIAAAVLLGLLMLRRRNRSRSAASSGARGAT